MKRRIASDHSFGGMLLKRRSSSLFSIDTIHESPSRLPSELHFSTNDLLPPLEKNATPSIHVRSISNSSLYDTETEVSCDDGTGFYIDEEELSDDETENIKLIPTFTSVKSEEEVETTVEESTTDEQSGDLRTGMVFEAGAKHFDRHNRLHKERPVRVTSVMDALEKSSLHGKVIVLDDQVQESSPEMLFLDDDDYRQVHLPGYMKRYVMSSGWRWNGANYHIVCLSQLLFHLTHFFTSLPFRLDKLSNCNCCDRLNREAEQFKSIYFTKDTVAEAKTAATSLCRLVTKVVEGDLDNGFAVIRPPGHHAEPGLAGGYCVINNVAVAASYAREKLGLERVLIVDWDVHHGNGTQSIFLNDPNVLYFSVHRWHGGNFFPFLQNGGPTTVGIDDGEGFNVNVGWSRKGMGDDEYLAVWEKLLMPMAHEFQPDLVLVSAGFDAALGDMGRLLACVLFSRFTTKHCTDQLQLDTFYNL